MALNNLTLYLCKTDALCFCPIARNNKKSLDIVLGLCRVQKFISFTKCKVSGYVSKNILSLFVLLSVSLLSNYPSLALKSFLFHWIFPKIILHITKFCESLECVCWRAICCSFNSWLQNMWILLSITVASTENVISWYTKWWTKHVVIELVRGQLSPLVVKQAPQLSQTEHSVASSSLLDCSLLFSQPCPTLSEWDSWSTD